MFNKKWISNKIKLKEITELIKKEEIGLPLHRLP